MDQKTAETTLKLGYNVFITGSAGTGKTFILNNYISYLKERGIIPSIVASTGIAASHINGQTIHSFFGIGIKETLQPHEINNLVQRKHLISRFEKLKVLIIDEISMVSPELFSLMNILLQRFKFNSKPFGGIQVVISGDFFQLPPVSKIQKEKIFAWQSEAWKELDLKTCYLQKKFRQTNGALIDILDDIRSGNISEKTILKLNENIQNKKATKTTKLYTHNLDVDRINLNELQKLKSKPINFIAETKGSKQNIETFFKNSLLMEELVLKKDAIVMFLKNDPDGRFINGTIGVVTGFTSFNMPIVSLSNNRNIFVGLEEWSKEDDSGREIVNIKQIPLRLAWAITTHKSQGMTIDNAEIDLSRAFMPGQGYVALSRLTSIDGLSLIGYNDLALKVDPLILHIDDYIKRASEETTKLIREIENKKKLFSEFILSNGGFVDKDRIKIQKKNLLKNKKNLGYKKTKEFINKSSTLKELCKKRDLSINTVIDHLEKLKKENVDIDKYKPSKKLLKKVFVAKKNILNKNLSKDFLANGSVKLKSIYIELGEKVSYSDISLCLIFE
jgi:ATP-dependent exoDNAse (exonuclease V) alpha subunit